MAKKDRYKTEIIDPNDRASKLAHQVCVASYKNSGALEIIPRQPKNFRGSVDHRWKRQVLKGMIKKQVAETTQNDGAGGKPQFLTLVGTNKVFFGLGWEIITMCADDIARSGGFAALMSNDINVKKVTRKNFHLIESALLGYGAALRTSGLVNITGEIAIMKHSITAFCDSEKDNQLVLTWGGTCLGLSRPDRFIDGSGIEPGMPIVGFQENGYRCNGGTFFTNLLLALYSHGLPENIMRNRKAVNFAEKLTVPSISYAKTIARANGWKADGTVRKPLVKMMGIAHITGGGVWGKFGEMLPEGVGAQLIYMPAPPPVLLEAQKLSWNIPDLRLTDHQAYGTLHGGCGALIVCRSINDVASLIKEAIKDGIRASVVGITTSSKNREVIIRSRFKEKKMLSSLQK